MNKAIIFDSSTLINFTLNGLLPELVELKKNFNGKFLVTKEVIAEVVDTPMKIKRFKLEALKLKRLIDDKVLESPSELGVSDGEVSSRTKEISNIANNTFFGRGNAIQIIHSGEMSCLALSDLLDQKKIKNVLSVDERTTRMLSERPENMYHLLQKKLHTKITFRRENFEYFKKFRFIRSTELIYIAYKKGLVRLKNHDVLDALLWAFKMHGCSISDEEIKEIERMK